MNSRQTAERLQKQALIRAVDDERFVLAEDVQTRLNAAQYDTVNMSTFVREHDGHDDHDKQQVILKLCESPRTLKELQHATGFGSRGYFKATVIDPLLNGGFLRMTIPDKPRSKNQRYVLTEHGLHLLKNRSMDERK
ncbi:MAG: hypothetical protein GY801_48410 [bacterium]|nr:hypothetical protein [bacterium]